MNEKTGHSIILRSGSESKLNGEQTQELLEHLQRNTYLKAKEICKYVQESYRITYSVPGMIAWLKEHDFVYKQPIKVPGKLDPAKQEAFIEKYEELKKSLQKIMKSIFWMQSIQNFNLKLFVDG